MNNFIDTAQNYQPGIRIAPDVNRWVLTNGIGQLPVCGVCVQPQPEGHVNCTCDKNHPTNCTRPTYDQLDMLRVTYRNLLQALLDRHNSDSLALTILSPADVTEIEAALDWRGD